MKKLLVFFTIVLVVTITGGCSHHYTPRPSTFKLDQINEFSSTNSISLINTQTSTEDFLYMENMGHSFWGNRQSWTETAIAITQRELAARGMNVDDNTSKTLKLSVNSVKGTAGFSALRCELTLKAETGDGYVNTYIGDNRSPGTVYRAADGAVMRAVAEMLRDIQIINYLTK